MKRKGEKKEKERGREVRSKEKGEKQKERGRKKGKRKGKKRRKQTRKGKKRGEIVSMWRLSESAFDMLLASKYNSLFLDAHVFRPPPPPLHGAAPGSILWYDAYM